MQRIFKYRVPLRGLDNEGAFHLDVPQGAQTLAFKCQPISGFCVWLLVDDHAPKEPRKFYVCGTGQPLTMKLDACRYIGTAMTTDGNLVLHLFEPQ